MVNVHGLADFRHRKHAAKIGAERGIVGDAPAIAFEQAAIGHVEAHKGHEQPDVRFSKAFTGQKFAASQMQFQGGCGRKLEAPASQSDRVLDTAPLRRKAETGVD